MNTDVIIIGAGPVGLFAAFQAGMLRARSVIIDTLDFAGGQCSALYPEKPIYDIPGYPKISGQDLVDRLMEQSAPFKPEYHLGQQVIGLKQIDGGFEVTTSKNTVLSGKVILIAAGCGAFGPNRPPLDGIEEYEGKSIFYAVNKRDDLKGKRIVIAGGGDSAVDWTLSLAEVASKIYVIHRRDKFRCAPESLRQMQELVEKGIIEMVVPYQLSGLKGSNGMLQEVIVESMTGEIRVLEADVLLPFFGLKMSLGPILDWGLNITNHHIEVEGAHYETSIPGIYAVGDIATYPGKVKLILTGFAEVAASLHHAYPRLSGGKALHFEYSTSKGLPST